MVLLRINMSQNSLQATVASILMLLPLAIQLDGQTANSVRITDQSGSAQPSHPFTISRVFVKGDIPHFAQASVNGTSVPTQCDVKTRWPDGSVQHALISFVAPLTANGTITVSFVDQASGNNSGAMNQAAMLAANWGAQIEVTNGSTVVANARQILTDWSGTGADARVTYWLQGAICTQVILEDRSPALAYDIGWDTYKPLHPIFVVTFYPGYPAGTKVEMILENMWTTKLEDQTYSLALKTGNPLGAAVYTKAGYSHIAETRWRKTFWSGVQPGTVNIDFNLPYMISTQMFPNWDLSKAVPAGTVTTDVAQFNATDQGDLGGHSLWTQSMGQTGGRPDIGVFPAWYVRYLYTFNPGMRQLVMGSAEVSGYVPVHFRESASGTFFDSGHAVPAFGRALSIDARPTIYTPDFTYSGIAPPDKIVPISITTKNGWGEDLGHEPGIVYIPYLLTGDWYFLEELYFYGANALAYMNPGYGEYNRANSWGYFSVSDGERPQTWGLRDIAQAAFAAPDGTPEKAYFTEKVNNNIAVEEGEQNVVNGAFPPPNPACPGYTPGPSSNKWCYGRLSIGLGRSNPLHFMNEGEGIGQCDDPRLVAPGTPYAGGRCHRPWMMGYKFHVLGHMQELGFPIGQLNQTQFLVLLHMIKDPAFNPWLSFSYVMPVIQNSTNTYFQTWGDVLLGYSTSFPDACGPTYNLRTVTNWSECSSSVADFTDPGYPHIMKGSASYLAAWGVNDGALTGQAAWTWMVTNVGSGGAGVNPQFEVLPRGVPNTPPPSACDLDGSGVVDAADVQSSINRALGIVACGAGDLDGNGVCNVVDTQRVINASLGMACRLGP
jgi:hypothetical protein